MITQDRLRELLLYFPDTGAFIWRAGPRIGLIAGCGHVRDSHPYIIINLDGQLYKAHRLAWLYMTGEFPPDQIDHINGNGRQNQWSNLRKATHAENVRNNRGYKTRQKSRLKGVYQEDGQTRWRSVIRVDTKLRHLGYFDTEEEAHAAYVGAAALHFGEFANGG